MISKGKCWKFGDNIDTDQMIPADSIKNPVLMMQNCLRNIDPEYSEQVQEGDIVIAGENFGCGSSRPGALPMKLAGVAAVVAKSFDRIFFRNTVNIGLYPISCPSIVEHSEKGDTIEIDFAAGIIRNLSSGYEAGFEPLSPLLQKIIDCGGYLNYLEKEGLPGE